MHVIGKIKPKNRVFLAPMAGYSTLPYRLLCKGYGAGMCYTELASVKAIMRQNKKTLKMLETTPEEKPTALQLFGSNEKEFAKATEAAGEKFDIIDINAGCSVPKVLKQEAGSYLLKKPEKIGKIIGAISGKTNKPITLKTRLGVDEKNINVLGVLKKAEDAGCAAIAIHARTVEQGFGGKARWEWIKKAVQKAKSIKVIGNGDVCCAGDAKKMLESTECDFAMIGRAALGNAFLFKQCSQLLAGKKIEDRAVEKKRKEFLEFCKLEEKWGVGLGEFKAMAMHYMKGEKNAAKARNSIARAGAKKEINDIVSKTLS